MVANEQKDRELLDVIAYPFIVRSTSSLSAKEFIFSISLDALLCSPSTALLILKCGINKGLLIFDPLKRQISTTFDYYKFKGLSFPNGITKLIKAYCPDAANCCGNIPLLKNLSDLFDLRDISPINTSVNQSNNAGRTSKELEISKKKVTTIQYEKEKNRKKRNKSKSSNQRASSLEDYF